MNTHRLHIHTYIAYIHCIHIYIHTYIHLKTNTRKSSYANNDRLFSKESPTHKHKLTQIRIQKSSYANSDRLFFSPDDELHYFPFCDDFGPMNLGMTYRFICMVRSRLEAAKKQVDCRVCLSVCMAVCDVNSVWVCMYDALLS